jgi:hypothetical protein
MAEQQCAGDIGALSELAACAWLLRRGYEVFRNVSPNGPADLVAWRPGYDPILVDVKTLGGADPNIKNRLSPTQQGLGVRVLGVFAPEIYVNPGASQDFKDHTQE